MRKLFVVISVLIVLSMALAACQTATPTAAPVAATTAPTTVAATTAASAAAPATAPKSKDPSTFVEVTAGDIVTLDPAYAYDTASGGVLQSTYETLIFFDGANTNKYVPMLATEVPTVENGDISADGLTVTWKIRSGVKFHNGDVMTPSDVAFSFQRGLLQGGTDSPQWMLYPMFLGSGINDIAELVDPSGKLDDDRAGLAAADPTKIKDACTKVQSAIVADDAAGTVTFHLAQPAPAMLGILAQTWGAVMDAKWVAANKGWDGSCTDWPNYYGQTADTDPFTNIENGTGPFVLSNRNPGTENDLTAFPDYWGTKPALKTVEIKYVTEWGTRFSMYQTGDADVVYVPVEDRSQVDPLVGEKCVWDTTASAYAPCTVTDPTQPLRLYIGQPQPTVMDVIAFNFNVPTTKTSPNAYIGSGKMDGGGIAPDFFGDVNIRKGFAYSFDWDTYIKDVYNGEAVQSVGITMPGMVGYDPNTPHYTFDLAKATEAFKAADTDHNGTPDGQQTTGGVWNNGFFVMMLYNTGNTTRQTMAEILAADLAKVNPKFVVQPLGLPWAAYLAAIHAHSTPLWDAGWQEDYPDPDDWWQPYTIGSYGGYQNLPADLTAQFKALLVKGATGTTDAERAPVYQQMSQLYYDNAVGIPLTLATSHAYEQRWVHGIVRNPLFSDIYYATITKD